MTLHDWLGIATITGILAILGYEWTKQEGCPDCWHKPEDHLPGQGCKRPGCCCQNTEEDCRA